MRNLWLILITPVILTACAANPNVETTVCNGHRAVNIQYGDSKIVVHPPLIKINKAVTLRFNLQSAGAGYDTRLVTIKGKNRHTGQWLDVSGTESANGGKLEVCVPGDQTADVYYYSVTVDTVGELDPRAEVED